MLRNPLVDVYPHLAILECGILHPLLIELVSCVVAEVEAETDLPQRQPFTLVVLLILVGKELVESLCQVGERLFVYILFLLVLLLARLLLLQLHKPLVHLPLLLHPELIRSFLALQLVFYAVHV